MRSAVAISTLALLASSSLAFAQGPGGGRPEPGGGAGTPPAAQQSAPGQLKEPGQSARDIAPGRTKGEGSARDVAPGRTGKEAEGRASGAERGNRERRSEDSRSDRKAGAGDDKRAADKSDRADRRDKDDREDRADRDRDDGERADRRERREGSSATGRSEGTAGRSGGADQEITQISGEQRTKVKQVFTQHRTKSVNVNINVAVGVAVPRTIELYAVPEDVVVIVPAYRRYRYFVVDDRICIVDPDTYVIVEVIVIA